MVYLNIFKVTLLGTMSTCSISTCITYLHALEFCWIFYRLVEFADKEGMRYALDKLDGEELDGKKIRLVEEKRGGGRRSRSRSPPPRRSR